MTPSIHQYQIAATVVKELTKARSIEPLRHLLALLYAQLDEEHAKRVQAEERAMLAEKALAARKRATRRKRYATLVVIESQHGTHAD